MKTQRCVKFFLTCTVHVPPCIIWEEQCTLLVLYVRFVIQEIAFKRSDNFDAQEMVSRLVLLPHNLSVVKRLSLPPPSILLHSPASQGFESYMDWMTSGVSFNPYQCVLSPLEVPACAFCFTSRFVVHVAFVLVFEPPIPTFAKVKMLLMLSNTIWLNLYLYTYILY